MWPSPTVSSTGQTLQITLVLLSNAPSSVCVMEIIHFLFLGASKRNNGGFVFISGGLLVIALLLGGFGVMFTLQEVDADIAGAALLVACTNIRSWLGSCWRVSCESGRARVFLVGISRAVRTRAVHGSAITSI